MALTPSDPLVREFNSLPRRERAPSGRVSNEWHFDVRYIQIEPTPSHVLVLINPQSQFLHMERLPVGTRADQSGIAFFPESGEEAAPEIAKALLHAFVNNLGQGKFLGNKAPPAFAPWRLTTECPKLREEVGKELKRLGVSPDALHRIGKSSVTAAAIADQAFGDVFANLKKAIGISGAAAPVIHTPESIWFRGFQGVPQDALRLPGETESIRLYNVALRYLQHLTNARPPKTAEVETKTMLQRQTEELQLVLKLIEEKPINVVQAAADKGDPKAAFDYGLRLLVGLGCKEQRVLARDYLIKALSATDASDELKATAHSLLIDWYTSSTNAGEIRSRYMFAACHHANTAAQLSKRVSPKGVPAPPAVVSFMAHVFEVLAKVKPELYFWYKDAVAALKLSNTQFEAGKQKMEQKRLKNPNRYRCAAVGCGIEADSGKMLSQCAGKCDLDKKPSYCSKECQKSDWKNHKPFCKPGMPCSVLDPDPDHPTIATAGGVAGPSSKQGAFQVPITHADGSTLVMSSSTIKPQTLKELRDLIQQRDPTGVPWMALDFEDVTI